jgi:hypothetical protein
MMQSLQSYITSLIDLVIVTQKHLEKQCRILHDRSRLEDMAISRVLLKEKISHIQRIVHK